MKLRATFLGGGYRADVEVDADPGATVGELAGRLAERAENTQPRDAYGLAVGPGTATERVVGPELALEDAGILSGDTLAVAAVEHGIGGHREQVASLQIEGPSDKPTVVPLYRGTNSIGRSLACDIRLTDRLVSNRHARIVVSDIVEFVDDQSANGIQIGGETVDRAIVQPGDVVTVGETRLAVALEVTQPAPIAAFVAAERFNRSPRLDPYYEGEEIEAPQPPDRIQNRRFPLVSLFAPLVLAGVIFSVTKNPLSVLFVALSPVMLVGTFLEQRYSNRRTMREQSALFAEELDAFRAVLQEHVDNEQQAREHEYPAVGEVVEAVTGRSSLMWTRRPDDRSFLRVRLGNGRSPSRSTIVVPTMSKSVAELRKQLESLVSEFEHVDAVPIVASLPDDGSLGIAGPRNDAIEVANAVITQIAGLHSPAEVVLAGISGAASTGLDWLKWLPHVWSEQSPLSSRHLAVNSTNVSNLLAELEDLVQQRTVEVSTAGPDQRDPMLPRVVLVVDDDAPADRSRLVQLAESGGNVGVHLVFIAHTTEALPAACRAFVDVGPSAASVGFLSDGSMIKDVRPERLTDDESVRCARALSPAMDVGARSADNADIPTAVSLLALGGTDLADSPDAVIEKWRQNHSLPTDKPPPQGRKNSLRALVGQSGQGPLHLDLRVHGPHALVGGTTGSGKSEFLQTWVLSMAAMHSPARVTFLFVDYKGGSAFGECIHLPHSVGMVTDLSPALVRRALTSLEAEIRHREHVLQVKKAKDLLELEARNDPEAPPSLVIVVDEFAALATDVPEFVDGVVNIAQRGRSLGLHLILATQRPAGVVRDNLRANTNLRIALRMADDADSTDVVGVPVAAGFDPDLPGRAVAKMGPGRLSPFQAAYVGGTTSPDSATARLEISDLSFAHGAVWEPPTDASGDDASSSGPNDLVRMVETIAGASQQMSLPSPRKPWLPELAPTVDLKALAGLEEDRRLSFGLADEPEDQRQSESYFLPDTDGSVAVFGTGGSGKSTLLRTLALAASMTATPDRGWEIYGLDFGSRGLQMLESLPTVGSIIAGDDGERVARLLRRLRATIDERADRYANARAGSLSEYRDINPDATDSRVLLLVDGVGAFRTAYEGTTLNRWWEMFQSIVADGRSVGVHVALSADRAAALSSGLSSLIQRRIALRLAGENEYMLLGVATDIIEPESPPGRALCDGLETQIAVLGGSPNTALQAEMIGQLADRLRSEAIEPTRPIERLPQIVERTELPTEIGGRPPLGLWDETLAPIAVPESATFLVTGPPGSGRTTALTSIARGIEALDTGTRLVLLAAPRSTLIDAVNWSDAAVGTDEIEAMAGQLAAEIGSGTADWAVFVEAVGDLINTPADQPVQALLRDARAHGHQVFAEGETSTLAGSWPLLQMVKYSRTGLALQPDTIDGDSLFKVAFPRVTRAEFPPGRGMLVQKGAAARVQVVIDR